MEIIQNELRLKDIDWVEKTLVQKAKLARIAGGTSLADKAKKEEAVSTRAHRARGDQVDGTGD